jgi:hypothetical protein
LPALLSLSGPLKIKTAYEAAPEATKGLTFATSWMALHPRCGSIRAVGTKTICRVFEASKLREGME